MADISSQAKAAKVARAIQNEIQIPELDAKAKRRRNRLLKDPIKFLKFYFPEAYLKPFAPWHLETIQDIITVAQYGGDKAIAAPRGDGKTQITKGVIIYCICRGFILFPVVVAATGKKANSIFNDIRNEFEFNDLLVADYPEICFPVRHLAGTPQKAAKQTHNGKFTRIEWKNDWVIFPHIEGSRYNKVIITWAGLDSAIRGINIRSRRPDFVLVDDPETRESADSPRQLETREITLTRDVAGLAGGGKRISMVVLCTLQNRRCLSAKLTDIKQSPSWQGKRYSALVKKPDRTDLWDVYVDQRKADQQSGDQFGESASQFYLDRQAEMDAGSEVLNQHRFDDTKLPSGRQIEYTALQSYYNLVADRGWDYVNTELQNDPPSDDEPQTLGLTSQIVLSRSSGLKQHELPKDTERIIVGLDLGRAECYWSKVAWRASAIGAVIDKGVLEVPGYARIMAEATKAGKELTNRSFELVILSALHKFRTEVLVENAPHLVLVDSGAFSQSVYQFIREVGGKPFVATKGWGDGEYRHPRQAPGIILGESWHGRYQPQDKIWLYHVDVDFWKTWLHQRWLTNPLDELNQSQPGSMSIFVPREDMPREHVAFAHHQVAEEYREEFIEGKGWKRYWHKRNRNNHWLDAMVLACAGANMLGIKLMRKQEPGAVKPPRPTMPTFTTPSGQPFLVTER